MRRLLLLTLLSLLAGCRPSAPPSPTATLPDSPSPTGGSSPALTFAVHFSIVRVSGVSCHGLEGPWRVRLHTPNPIVGSDRAAFRLPGGRGPGLLRWSFTASHPGQGQVVYAGKVRVRAFGSEEEPILRFTGKQTQSTGYSQGNEPVVQQVAVRVGGTC